MARPKKDPTLPPGEAGTPEATPPQNNTADTAASKEETAAESQVASATSTSDSSGATAPSPITQNAFRNPALPEQTSNLNPSPAEPETTERTPSHEDLDDAAASIHAAAGSQVAPAASDNPEATATGPVKQDTVANPDLPEQTTDANASPAEPGTAAPTSPQGDTCAAGATKDEVEAASQVPAAPSNAPENNFPPTAERYVKRHAEPDDGGCFEPYIPPDPAPPAPKPAPKPKQSSLADLIDKINREHGWVTTPADTPPESELPAAAATADSGDAAAAEPGTAAAGAPVETPQPPPRFATAAELFTWIKQTLLAQTHLPKDAAELIAFWVISTWFWDALTVFPCLLITGRAHDAIRVLYILKAFCPKAALLAGFDRSQLDVLGYYRTNLISEPNFDKRTANLLSCLTDKRFLVARGQYMARNSRSMAIYGGENPGTHRILNAIHIHMAPTHAALPDPPQSLPKMMKRVPAHLEQYRDRNLPCVDGWTWTPFGLSPETATIAAELGRCILDAPELRRRLLALLQIRDQDRLSEMSDTSEAIVLEATRALSRDEREQAYAREITVKANQLLEARGETMRLSPEKVGHQLKKLGLRTRPLSQRGHGLAFDKATVARINELAAMYMVDVMEDASAETGNFHSQQATEKK